jgi:hypothetical protein
MAETFDIQGQERERLLLEEKAKLQRKVEIDDLLWLMRDKRGRRIAHGQLERSGVFRSSFHTNALTMAFNEGGRNEGLRLLALLMQHCPELHTQMLKEHSEND